MRKITYGRRSPVDVMHRMMIRYDRNLRRLAIGLAALAGYVDAIGFLKSGGLFVSFMSGNSTRMAIGIAEGAAAALAAAGLIALFVFGVFATLIVTTKMTAAHRKVVAVSCLAALLLGAAILQTLGLDRATVAFLCLAMGASNTVFRRDGEVSIGVSYMTGTLVKLGGKLAEAALGGSRSDWLPYLLLWLALLVGGIIGAAGYAWSPDGSIGLAAAAAAALVPVTQALTRSAAR